MNFLRFHPRIKKCCAAAAVASILLQCPASASEFSGMAAAAPVDLSRYTSAAAVITETFKGTNGRTIIHIQDPHSSLSGQISLAAVVQELASREGIRLVMVEGSARDASLNPLRDLASPSIWSIVARRLLYERIISGEEYVNLTSDLPIRIMGIEYREQYVRQVQAYASLASQRGKAQEYLRDIRHAVKSLKQRLYPKPLMAFENLLERGHGLEEEHVLKIRALRVLADEAGISLSNFKLISKYVELQHQPLDGAIQDMADLFGAQFWEEIDRLEGQVYKSLLPTADLRTLRGIDQYTDLLVRGYGVQMSSDDMRTYRSNRRRFPTPGMTAFLNRKLADAGDRESQIPASDVLETTEGNLRRFYGLAESRDLAFTRNAEKIMEETGEAVGILIAGGYHTDRLTRFWRAQGTSYVVLTPLVADDSNSKLYESMIIEQSERALAAVRGQSTGGSSLAGTAVTGTVRLSDAITGSRLSDWSPPIQGFINQYGPEDQSPLGDRIRVVAARMAGERPERGWGLNSVEPMSRRTWLMRLPGAGLLGLGQLTSTAAIPSVKTSPSTLPLEFKDFTPERWFALVALWAELKWTLDRMDGEIMDAFGPAPPAVDANIRPRSQLTHIGLNTPAYLKPYEKLVYRYFGVNIPGAVVPPILLGAHNRLLEPDQILTDKPKMIGRRDEAIDIYEAYKAVFNKMNGDIERLIRERQEAMDAEVAAAAAKPDPADRDEAIHQVVQDYRVFVNQIKDAGYDRDFDEGSLELLNRFLIPVGYMVDPAQKPFTLYRIISKEARRLPGMQIEYWSIALEPIKKYGGSSVMVLVPRDLKWAAVDRSILELRERDRLAEWQVGQGLLGPGGDPNSDEVLEFMKSVGAKSLSPWFVFYNALMHFEGADQAEGPNEFETSKRQGRRVDLLLRPTADYAIISHQLKEDYPDISSTESNRVAIARLLRSLTTPLEALLFLSELGQSDSFPFHEAFQEAMENVYRAFFPDRKLEFYDEDMKILIDLMSGTEKREAARAKAWGAFVKSLDQIEKDWLRKIQDRLEGSGSRLSAPAKILFASSIPSVISVGNGPVPGFVDVEPVIVNRLRRTQASRVSPTGFFWMTDQDGYTFVGLSDSDASPSRQRPEGESEEALKTLLEAADRSVSASKAQPILYVMSARDAGPVLDEASRKMAVGVRAALTGSGRDAVLELPLSSDEPSFGDAQQLRLRRALRDGHNIVLMLSAAEVRQVYRTLRRQLDAEEWVRLQALTVHSPVRPGSAEIGTSANFGIAAARGRYLAGLKRRQAGSGRDLLIPADQQPLAAWLLKGVTRPVFEALMTVPVNIEETQFYQNLERAAFEPRHLSGYLADLRRALSASRLSA